MTKTSFSPIMSSLPADHLEKVYAGVLGKLIGVYLGRPFEGWTHERILSQLGPINYYVHDKLGNKDAPLVVVDDDISGTFAFVRALEEHGIRPDISPEAIGKTWLNNVIEHRSVFWWGGNGISTEHTAFLNLKKRGIPAPASGSSQTNGQTIAEQIGAQIFIDGWAMVAPGNPALAAQLAKSAASVSHDGEAVHAAMLLAAMEAEAFVSNDINHLLDVGLKFVPANSLIAQLVNDIRDWAQFDRDWKKTRQRIEDKYGYDKFGGICHVIPNHGLIILALLYGGHDFHRAMHIVNTSGWDTDCNSGNVGCLVAIMHGLAAFEGGPDWRGPVADRALISSADRGYSINNAARIAYDIANLGRQLAGEGPLPAPKHGAQFHFTLPGSVQGFEPNPSIKTNFVKVEQALDDEKRPGLTIHLRGLMNPGVALRSAYLDGIDRCLLGPIEVMTPTLIPPDAGDTKTYGLMASPLLYPGQCVQAVVRAEKTNRSAVYAQLVIKAYGCADRETVYGPPFVKLEPGSEAIINRAIPDDCDLDNQPIQQVGLALYIRDGGSDLDRSGTVWLDRLGWIGIPQTTFKRPPIEQPGDSWHRAWVNSVSTFHTDMSHASFCIAQDSGEGIITCGTRDWIDYGVTVPRLILHLGTPAGLAIRVQGLNRYYALLFLSGPERAVALIKARDEQRTELVRTAFDWKYDTPYEVSVSVQGNVIRGRIVGACGPVLEAVDDEYGGGGIGLVVTDGSVSANQFDVGSET
jgi:ADP-ribosylglycohydrolase